MRWLARRSMVAIGGIAAVGAAIGMTTGAEAGPAVGAPCEQSVPFRARADGYGTFRIPAVVTTRLGTLIAFAEGRRSDLLAVSGEIRPGVRTPRVWRAAMSRE